MQISVTLLLCAFVLCCTGSMQRVCARLHISTGTLAAVSLLCAAASGFELQIGPGLRLHAASCILILFALLLCRGHKEAYIAVFPAFLSGILAWFLQRRAPDFFEPALLLSLPSAALSLLLPLGARERLLCQTLSPIFFGFTTTLGNWYLFDYVSVSVGDATQLDMQICGLLLVCLAMSVPIGDVKKTYAAQKEY